MISNQNKIEFIIHRGSHQIGGNCVELVSPNARILIDCGLPLDYDEQDSEIQVKIHEDAQGWLTHCDAIFLSHYHTDHYGLLNEAPKGTRVYATKETADLMKISGIFGEDLTEHLDIQPVENTVTVEDFRVTKFDVDHSAFGACAFLFEGCGKRILYSGDIRLHGKKGELYKNLPQNVDYLFLEGTNLGRGVRQKTEDDVRDEFIQQFNSHPDSAFLVWCSAQNIDRIVALYNACVNSKRNLCIDPYTAYILNLVNQCNDEIPSTKTHSNLLVYYPNRFCSRLKNKRGDIHKEIVANSTKIQNDDPQKNSSKYVFVFRPNLLDFFRKHLANTSIRFIVSMWAQYWDKDTPDLKRFKNWLAAEPELRKRLPDIHTSGHADMASLQKIVEHVQPKQIIPIHTEQPEKYKTLFPNYTVINVADETQIDLSNVIRINMKILHISDTHGKHQLLKDLPEADVIVHTGDITEDGTEEEVMDFIEWFGQLPYKHKIFIAGNHDDCLYGANIEDLPDNVHYLCNDGITIDGVKFYGVPMFLQDDLDGNFPELFGRIPTDTDVLLTHQPPQGILDESDGINFGDYYLFKSVMNVMPKYHLFGHLHNTEETYCTFRRVRFSNAASSVQGRYGLLKI